jgi:hypothetical protein
MSSSPSHTLFLKRSSHIVRLPREIKVLAYTVLSGRFVVAKGVGVVFVVAIVELGAESLVGILEVDTVIVRYYFIFESNVRFFSRLLLFEAGKGILRG